jgi:hypothetical protein
LVDWFGQWYLDELFATISDRNDVRRCALDAIAGYHSSRTAEVGGWAHASQRLSKRQISESTRGFVVVDCPSARGWPVGQARRLGTIFALRAKMGWFQVASSRLRYRGRLSQESYAAWAKTSDGSVVIDDRAREDRLRLFPRSRARRRIWRELELAARSEPLCSAIQSETHHFAAAIVEASHAPGLPRRTIELHRLVIVPRALVAARTRTALRRRLFKSPMLGALDPRVRDFLCEQLVVELDAAVAEGRPSVFRPLLTHEAWGCVGRDTQYQWVDPMFSGPGWGGHLLMFEFPREGLSRKARKAVDQAVHDLQNSLTNISHVQRHAIVRMAVDGLPRLTA